MRLGLLGPAQGNQEALERAAGFLRGECAVNRIVYLGIDGALDRVVQSWAEQLVGAQVGESALCARATARCLNAGPEEIDAYLVQEEERSKLRMFESLPGDTTRAVELLAGRVAVMIYDKAYLEEEDILPATWLMFGRNPEALIKRIGRRWFLAPGSFPSAGVMVVEDEEGAIRVSSYSPLLEEVSSERLEVGREVNLRVSGAD